jgi:hypothetical protein
MATAKRKTAKKGAKARKTTKKAARPADDKVANAARRAAEFLGMDPNEAAATAGKWRDQTQHAGARIKEEVGRLGERAEALSAKFDVQVKQGVRKVEQVADEMAKGLGLKPDELSAKLEKGLDRWSKEAQKVADEANAEIKKMYEQARGRLKDILNKKHQP